MKRMRILGILILFLLFAGLFSGTQKIITTIEKHLNKEKLNEKTY